MRRERPEPAATAAIYLLVVGLPLAVSASISDTLMPLRLLVLGIGLAVALFAPGQGRLPRPIGIALAVAVAVFVAAALAGQTPELSLLGRYPRDEGLPVVLGYAAALAGGARLLGPGAARLRRHALNGLVVAALTNAAVAAIQLATTPEARVTGTLGNSTTLATFSLIVLALVTPALAGRPWWYGAGAGAAGFCLVVAASRGALLGAAVAAAALVAVRLAAHRRGRWWWGPAVAAGVLALALVSPGSRARITGATPFAEATINGRLLLWQETLELVARHPVLGVGPSRFVDSIGGFHSPAWAAEVGPYAPPDSPHLVVLQVAAGTGWLGVAATVAIVGTVVFALWRARPWDAWQLGAVLAGVAVATSYLTSFTDPVTLTVLLFLVGGAVSSVSRRTAPRGRPVTVAAGVTAAVLGVTLGGSAVIAEARYSAAVEGGGDATAALLAVPAVRPWDPDLARRVGYTAARLAEAGRARPAAFVDPLRMTCARLPGSVECLQSLADVHDLAGEHEASLATLAAAAAADPHNVDTILRRGISLTELARYPEAVTAFQLAATLRPTAPEPWDDLARVYELSGRGADAVDARARADALRHR
jgi:O-antigen ligase